MKQKKSPHSAAADKLNPLPKGEEVNDSLIAINAKILQRLSTLEDLLRKKDDHAHRQTSKPLTFKEACAYLGYAPSYLYKLTYRNVIPHYKPTGKMIFFSKNEIDEWIFKSRPHLDPLPKGEEELTKDPNQLEMELQDEVLIEFPLKSRRKKAISF
jgi:excisionase family DNA binding protein